MNGWLESGETHIAIAVGMISLALAVTLLHFFLEPWRWRVAYLVSITSHDTVRRVRDALWCTALATYLLPFKLGIPLRLTLLKNNARLGTHFVVSVLALDGLISLCAWSVVTVLSVWVAALQWRPPWFAWILGLMVVLAFAVTIALRQRLRGRVAVRWHEAMALLDQPWRRVGTSMAILLLDVLSYGVRHALLVSLVTGTVDLALAAGAIGVVATFAGIVSGLPMGLLGYDATLLTLLSAVGVRMDQAIGVILINRALNIGAAALLGIPASMRLGVGSGIRSILYKLKAMASGQN